MGDGTTSEQVAGVFGRTASTYDTVIPFFESFGHLLVDLAEAKPGERVLDVAAGRGASALPVAAEVGPEGYVLAVDLAPEMVELLETEARGRGLAHLETRIMDAMELDVADDFDLVLCGFALQLMPDPERVARNLRAALRPGGRCVVSFPSGPTGDWRFFGRVLHEFSAQATRAIDRTFKEIDLAAVLGRAGFGGIRAIDMTVTFTFEDAEEWWRWIWSQGMRAMLESFEPDVLEQVRARMLEEVGKLREPQGIDMPQSARFLRAEA